MSRAGLERYVAWLHSKAEREPFGTVIVRHGKIVCEYYGSGADAGSKWEIGSIRKSVTSGLLGMAIAEGKLSLDSVVDDLWPEIRRITGAEKDKQIRMRHLATNASGWMTGSRPSEAWLYNNAACTAGGAVLGRVYGMPEDRIAPLVAERIARKIHAGWDCYHFDQKFSPGSHRQPGPKLAIDSSLRDLARYGYLWLREGEWNGVQIIPRDYVREARQNQVAHLGGHYGYWWFTNDGRVLLPGVPEDAFFHGGNGRNNRRMVLLVAPVLDLVAVVGTGAGAYDITSGFTESPPIRKADEWIRKIVEAVQPAKQFYFPPPGESLEAQSRRSPEQAGFDPKVIQELEGAAARWALWRYGHLIHVKGNFNEVQEVASNRKTWHALTVGAAIKQGRIPSLRQKISVWNRELTGKHAEATWWHVITQSAGFDYPYGEYPAFSPGKMWTYSDLNLVQLGNALARVYGRRDHKDNYEAVVKEAYFDAIGMRGWRTHVRTKPVEDGIGFYLDLEDMGRLGLLVLARGKWKGNELIPEWFVEELETKQTSGMLKNYRGPNDGLVGLDPVKFREAPYGFMTWVNTEGDYYPGADRAWAFAAGKGGSYTLWNHKHGIVFAAFGAQTGPTAHGVPHILEAHLLTGPAMGVEIATGKMLGQGYDARAFYLREKGGQWRKTYTGPQFRPAAAGRLMNLRIAQGLYHDEWLTEFPFDPEENTSRLIRALDTYKEHGILAINVSLQAGNAGYNREFQGVKRNPEAKFGPGKGTLTSAFRPDGSLKEAWMKRALRLARELDRRGMILDLMIFYQGQDEVFENTEAIDRAVRNATDWLIANDCRNVIIEIANEHDVARYDHDRYIHREMARLIEVARERFSARKAAFRLPISASTGGSMRVFEGVREHADLVIIHGNGRTPEEKRKRTAELVADAAMPGPIHMNEDDNGRDTTPENLARELASCDAVWESGGSWGYMPWRQVQMFPFRFYQPSRSTQVTADIPVDERDPAYFHAVLDHVQKLVMR